jgi:hypothetical protein
VVGAPFIVGALLYPLSSCDSVPSKSNGSKLKNQALTLPLWLSQPFTFDIVQPPKSAPVEVPEPDFHIQEETTHIVDPFVDLPDVYRKPVSWENTTSQHGNVSKST